MLPYMACSRAPEVVASALTSASGLVRRLRPCRFASSRAARRLRACMRSVAVAGPSRSVAPSVGAHSVRCMPDSGARTWGWESVARRVARVVAGVVAVGRA